MKQASILSNLTYLDIKPKVELLLDTEFSKELRIIFKSGQSLQEHKAPFPIIIEVLEGNIDFGVEGKIHHLDRGDILTIGSNVLHDLLATENSIVRLSLSKGDHVSRVKGVGEKK